MVKSTLQLLTMALEWMKKPSKRFSHLTLRQNLLDQESVWQWYDKSSKTTEEQSPLNHNKELVQHSQLLYQWINQLAWTSHFDKPNVTGKVWVNETNNSRT